MKKVFFIIPSLGGGGAERVFLHLVRNVDRTQFSPHIVLFRKEGEFIADIPRDVTVTILIRSQNGRMAQGLDIFLRPAVQLARLLRRERPDCLISFMWYANATSIFSVMLSRVRCRVVTCERSTLTVSFDSPVLVFLRRFAIRTFYRMSDLIIVNSDRIGDQFKNLFGFPRDKLRTIYNPLDPAAIAHLSLEPVEHPWFRQSIPVIVGAGRLTKEKGFDYLIQAVHRLNVEGTDCRLLLLGKGIDEPFLKTLANRLGISNKVSFAGFHHNPYKYYSHATIFVLSSLFEGFPNVLLESLSLGIPTIATRCPTGPEEIITDGINGILVPVADTQALADAIKMLIIDEPLRKRLSQAGKLRSMDFEVKKIVKQFEKAIEDVCAASAEK